MGNRNYIDDLFEDEIWDFADIVKSSQQKANQEREKKENEEQIKSIKEELRKKEENKKKKEEAEKKWKEQERKKEEESKEKIKSDVEAINKGIEKEEQRKKSINFEKKLVNNLEEVDQYIKEQNSKELEEVEEAKILQNLEGTDQQLGNEETEDDLLKEIAQNLNIQNDKLEEEFRKQEEQEREKEKLIEEISKKINKNIDKQEKEIRKEMRKEAKQEAKKKKIAKRKIQANKDILINREKYPRFTAPKDRSILNRLMLQHVYRKEKKSNITERYLEEKEFLKEEDLLDENNHLDSNESFYKEVQEYEDMIDDYTIRQGWRKFKIGLATVALTATSFLAVNISSTAKKNDKDNNLVVIEESNTEESETSETSTGSIENYLEKIKNESGFEMKEFTEEEQIDAVEKIKEAEESMKVSKARSSFKSMEDQEYLTSFVEEAYGDEYSKLSEEQQYELRKLAYELITDENVKAYIRDPENVKIAEETTAQKSSESKESEEER